MDDEEVLAAEETTISHRNHKPRKERLEARRLWEESRGAIDPLQIAKMVGVPKSTIYYWKKKDCWGCVPGSITPPKREVSEGPAVGFGSPLIGGKDSLGVYVDISHSPRQPTADTPLKEGGENGGGGRASESGAVLEDNSTYPAVGYVELPPSPPSERGARTAERSKGRRGEVPEQLYLFGFGPLEITKKARDTYKIIGNQNGLKHGMYRDYMNLKYWPAKAFELRVAEYRKNPLATFEEELATFDLHIGELDARIQRYQLLYDSSDFQASADPEYAMLIANGINTLRNDRLRLIREKLKAMEMITKLKKEREQDGPVITLKLDGELKELMAGRQEATANEEGVGNDERQ
jgi:hypothetical protein